MLQQVNGTLPRRKATRTISSVHIPPALEATTMRNVKATAPMKPTRRMVLRAAKHACRRNDSADGGRKSLILCVLAFISSTGCVASETDPGPEGQLGEQEL